jgi:DNA-binding NarL/FixJ family response regulator
MNQIISDVLRSQQDIDVTEVAAATVELEAVGEHRPDVVILEQRHRPGTAALEPMLSAYPRLKVLAITDEGRESYLYELRPHEVALGQLSAATLLGAVRASQGR